METSNLEAILENRGAEPSDIMEVLQDVQASYGYLPEEALRDIAASFGVPLVEVFGLASFYKAFSLVPRGRHLLMVCDGTACHVRGAPRLVDGLSSQLGIHPGGTTEDRAFTLDTVNCLGACALGPVVVLDGNYHDHMTPDSVRGLLSKTRAADSTLDAAGGGANIAAEGGHHA
jgi:NADH:ubiquinone oxidoreductase subunit E